MIKNYSLHKTDKNKKNSMSRFFLVGQKSYKNKEGKTGLLTTLLDEKGNSLVTTSVGEIDPRQLPELPEVAVEIEAGTVFEGRISSRITGVKFM